MTTVNIRLDLRATPRMFRYLLALLLLSGMAGELASESVSLSTYLPAPSGAYTKLVTQERTYLARDGGYVEVGSQVDLTGTPNTKMVVMGGRVGLGTTNPGGELEVVGAWPIPAITVSDTSKGYASFATAQAGFGFVYPAGALQNINADGVSITNAQFTVPPADGLYVQGRVGIGISAPNGKLDVEGAGGVFLNAGNVGIGITGVAALDVNGAPNYVAAACGALAYGSGYLPCGANTYATWIRGINVYYQSGTQITEDGSGTMYCCPCPSGGCLP